MPDCYWVGVRGKGEKKNSEMRMDMETYGFAPMEEGRERRKRSR